MRVTAARTALAAAGLAVVGLVGSASAATTAGPKTLVITDAAGDSLGQPGDDLTKVTYTTTGKKVGKTYTPTALVVTLETAGDISTNGVLTYEVDTDLAGCDAGFDLYFTPGVDGSEGGGCLNSDPADPTSITSTGVDGPPTVGGHTMTWTISLKADVAFKAGSKISGFHAYTGAVEPVVGFIGPYLVDTALANDDVSSDATYTIG